MFDTLSEAALNHQCIEKLSKLAAAECIDMQWKKVLENQLEYARTEVALQQKFSDIETANAKARIEMKKHASNQKAKKHA